MAATVEVFTDRAFGGRRLVVTPSRRSLTSRFSGTISSVKTSTPVALFTAADNRGDALIVTEDAASLARIRGRNFDNRARSVLASPVTIKLNVIVGAIGQDPARSFDLINRDVAEVNQAFGPFGIRVDVDELRVGGALLHTPHTIETFEVERGAQRSADHLNVTYFNGPLYRPVSWRWRVQSAKVTSTRGVAAAMLWDQTSERGNGLRVSSDLAVLPASHRNRVMSIGLAKNSKVTVFSEPNFGGQARTFCDEVDDLDTRFGYFDWWKSQAVRITGNTRDWRNFDIWMQPGSSQNSLVWAVGRALGVQIGSRVTHDDAEAALEHIFANSNVRRATRIG